MTLIDAMFHVCVFLLCFALFWIFILMVVTSLQGFWVDKDSLLHNLEDLGYSEIKILRHCWFLVALRGGGKDDVAKFIILAKNPQGKRKEFIVFAKPASK